MDAFWSGLSQLEKIFFLCAVAGGVGFLLSVLLQFFGGNQDTDVIDTSTHGLADSDVSFKLISFFGLTSFVTMFGLVGLAMSHASQFNPILSIGGGVVGGALNFLLMKTIFRSFKKLQSHGKSSNQ